MKHMHMGNIIQTEQIIGRAMYVHVYLYAFNNNEKEAMHLKETKKSYMCKFRWRKWKGEIIF